jgi:hypothetical protein
MSKASEYAEQLRITKQAAPNEFRAQSSVSGDVEIFVAQVTWHGEMFLGKGQLSSSDALRLRDWITENFE